MKGILIPSEVARMYGVTTATVRNWIHAGKLKAYATLGGHYRIWPADLDAFMRDYAPPLTRVPENAVVPRPRLLLAGPDTGLLNDLARTAHARWPAARVEIAHDELEIGWWLAEMHPTTIAVHRSFDWGALLEQYRRLGEDGTALGIQVLALPDSADDGLREWLEQIDAGED